MTASTPDPRYRNRLLAGSTASAYLKEYAQALKQAIESVDESAVDRLYEMLCETLDQAGQVLVAGNGGSAAIADHLCCDWMKGTRAPGCKTLKVHSLVSNAALTTAIANDFGYDLVFSTQIEMMASSRDLVVLVSSSGNSANVIKAAEQAKSMGLRVVAMTGFDGGALRDLAEVTVYVYAHNYGLVEDAHQAIMHTLAQALSARQDRSKLHR